MGDPVKNTVSEEQLKKDKEIEKLTQLNYFYDKKGSFREACTSICGAIADGKVSMEDVKENLHRKLVSKTPNVSKDAFYEMFHVADKDRLHDEEIEKRRQLSEKAVDAHIEVLVEQTKAWPQIENFEYKGSTQRWINYFFMKPNSKYADANMQTLRDLYGLDENNQPKNISKDELGKTRAKILKDRIDEYKAIIDSFQGIEITDEKIIENYAKLSEVGVGMGMEWQNIVQTYKTWGVEIDKETLKKAEELNTIAYYINDALLGRTDYIETSHYQFGAKDYIAKPELMGQIADPVLSHTVMGVVTNTSFEPMRVFDTFVRTLKLNEKDIDFIYDDKGNEISADSSGVPDALKNSSTLMVFKKGQKDPVIVAVGSINRIPPEINEAPLTPEMKEEARSARFDHRMAMIEKSKMPQERKEFEENLIANEFETQTIARSLKSAPEDMKAQYEGSLKDSLAQYVARVAVQKKLDSANLDIAVVKQLVSEETVSAFMKDFRNSELLDRIYNDVSNRPGGLEELGPDDLFDSIVKNQKAINNEMLAKQKEIAKVKEEKQQISVEKIKDTIKSVRVLNVIDTDRWGITEDDKREVIHLTQMKELSLDRASLPTIALAVMLDKGYTVEELMKEGPVYDQVRKKCGEEAKQLVSENRGREIAERLLAATEKVNAFLNPYFKDMKNMDPAEYLSEKFRDARVMIGAVKDLFQETNTANAFLNKQSKEFVKEHPTEAVPGIYMPLDPKKVEAALSENDSYGKINAICTGGVSDILFSFDRKADVKVMAQAFGNYTINHLRGQMLNGMLKANPDKNILQVMNTDEYAMNHMIKSLSLAMCPGFRAVQAAAENPIFANKLVFSMLDGSLFNDGNCKFEMDEAGECKFEIDGDKIIKEVNDRYLGNLNHVNDKKLNEPDKQKAGPEGPDGPAV